MMYVFLAFLFGLFIGSFLGVVINRFPRHESVFVGRSYCETCKHILAWYDLIPIFSYVYLKGKCHYCKTKLSLFYPLIELVTGFLFAIAVFIFITPLTLINLRFLFYFFYLLAMISSFILIFFIDFKKGIIPDSILIFDIVLILLWLSFNPLSVIVNHLLSGIGCLLFFVAVSYIFYLFTRKEGMGGGDVKLSFVLGLFFGFPGIFIALYLAFILGAIGALFLIFLKKKKFQSALPFGPFLVAGSFLTLFFQSRLNYLFFKIFGL